MQKKMSERWLPMHEFILWQIIWILSVVYFISKGFEWWMVILASIGSYVLVFIGESIVFTYRAIKYYRKQIKENKE